MDAKILLNQQQHGGAPNDAAQEEFMLLMSLALDDLLDESERTQFEAYLTQSPWFVMQWRNWQQLHQQFTAAPHIEPAPGFTQRFETRLLQQERRRQIWFGVVVGVTAFVLWGAILSALVSVGAYFFVQDANWLGVTIQQLTYLWVGLGEWFKSAWQAFDAFANTPQARVIGIGYLFGAILMLGAWLQFLRRSIQVGQMVYE